MANQEVKIISFNPYMVINPAIVRALIFLLNKEKSEFTTLNHTEINSIVDELKKDLVHNE